MIFDNKQTSITGTFNLTDSIENYRFINIIHSYGGNDKSWFAINSDVYNVEFIKTHYNRVFVLSSSKADSASNLPDIEHIYIMFINKKQFKITEVNSVTTNNSIKENNKLRKIYAWN